MVEFTEITCPTCWERFSLPVQPDEAPSQELVIDCEICCRPIRVVVTRDAAGRVSADAHAENE